ncbi:nicotinate-nucleotide--dimethylbenzimidazole phosphoribosyltransferase [Corynebacterium sp. 153RC1]|uniref:nicotinate-nucleotide--dimethylbenzimidazole phosphoribosyltransferase n=1 Tax=unclassified Corynebacterium TaxID=2624378 RepID=UPI00211C3D13|nr:MULTISPECIES: nicotinate-nucleotide--dimethylbenzimidazole phosphoribosyltransferase [unclassified Corynebacterium]MCQ9369838.1 nicotinate-nucleotide--dimethylbenzimidazole phosphoribosyltransferase [Corynebacterium sp. 35RC1]MCQ9352283.1 nicotinate-nucleotide--dimethylbenzimidazole phosphoribosyltransferase [Corynebacterium sp. 209RC1]MCQ9354327.1 nicotinate-nucleotide--dimethylbenzimidazole phosphoribosyltransferase [Corynebacterium sp. 1222RC1]MCQ9356609.1 nicotinate-nucleotide--dimethylb
MQPSDFFPKVERPSQEAEKQARQFQLNLTKPTGSLARLEDLGVWLSACQDQVPPRKITRPRLVVFAGDHGIATKNVSPYPIEVSIQMAENIRQGGAGVNVIANQSGTGVRVADISLNHDAWGDERVSKSCGSIDREDAMTEEQLIRAIEIGKRIADQEIDSGADLLMGGDLGIGNTTPSAVIIGLLTNQEPVVVTGRGSGVDDEGWKRKVEAVRDAMFRARKHRGDVLTMMRMVTSPELAAMAAFIAQAAVRRTPVLLDGVVVTASALLAEQMAPGARRWMQAGHQSAEPAHQFALEYLGLTPLLTLGLRLGEGSGAAAAVPLVKMGADIMNDMATFESAQVSGKNAVPEGRM